MRKKPAVVLLLTLSAAQGLCEAKAKATGQLDSRLNLREGWMIQSSAKVPQGGEAISTPQFKPEGWDPATVPSTVLAALLADKVYLEDPYFGMNLRAIPGTSYPIGKNFSNLSMPKDSPFRRSWWYRTQFQIPSNYEGKTIWLHFDGINYRANLWLNGHKIAGSDQIVGMWRVFEFDVTGLMSPGKTNALALEVFPPQADDLAMTWVDWNPMPPDKEMGIWRDVFITTSGPVALRYPQAIAHLKNIQPVRSPESGLEKSKGGLPDTAGAELTVTVEARNATGRAVKGTVRGSIEAVEFSQEVELAPHESKLITFTPDRFPQLKIAHPRLWWPAELGPQNLYPLSLEFDSSGEVSDRQAIRFGIREVTSELDERNHRVFRINGRKILIKGGGWAPDMLLRVSPERQEAEIRYALDMHLNTIRLEGKIEDEHFFNLCDQYGMLVLAGWCCCDHWEKWKNWKPEDYTVARESLRDQIRRLRTHPSVFDWLNGSDNPPPARVETMYIKVLEEEQWPNPYQSSASATPTSVTGKSGVKMTGPYDYVAPSYWLEDTSHGGAFGFNTETSPGPAIPVIESVRQMLPADHLWPIDKFWDFHAGGGEFKNFDIFNRALNARYGNATGLDDYVEKAQIMAYEGERAMFEAYRTNQFTSTGVIQWMLNNAWPSMIWHLYDYYLRPGGGYFGTKKACEPVHVQYAYRDRSIVVVNSTDESYRGFTAGAKLFNLDLAEKFSRDTVLDVPAGSSHALFAVPEPAGLTRTYFLSLTLKDSSGKLVSSNFYWLSTKPDVNDFGASRWYYTPVKSYADFRDLKNLPAVELRFSSSTERRGEDELNHIAVENPTSHLAFFVHLEVKKGKGGDDVRPILWEDNYFPLMPGEKRQVTASYRAADLGGAQPAVQADGWNVVPARQ